MQHHRERKPLRLPHYDYSMPGAYFVTACTKNRDLLFETDDARRAVESAWYSMIDVFAHIELGEFVVMPNHIHGILWIIGQGSYRLHPGTWKNDNLCRDRQLPIPTEIKFETLSNIMGAFKTTAATRVNKLRGTLGAGVWQKSFYERVARNERELECIQKYIRNNPAQWIEDHDNPENAKFQSATKSIHDYWDEIFDLHV